MHGRAVKAQTRNGMKYKDYYATLGVKKDATADEIKKALRVKSAMSTMLDQMQ